MLVIVQPDAQAVSRCAAAMVAGLAAAEPGLVLGLAAGATPVGMYGDLMRRRAEGLDLSRLTLFGLDEYLDLPPDHPASCTAALRRHVIEPLRPDPARLHLLDTLGDPAQACAAHEQAIVAAGGIGLQILGLGINGHIGFNEPGSSFASRTRVVGLSASTRQVNRPGFAPGDTPAAAITMGIATILDARRVLLLATGAAKAETVATFVEGPLTARVPASALHLHPDAVVLLDEAAASRLKSRADHDAQIAVLSHPATRTWATNSL